MTKIVLGAASLNQTPLDWENNIRNIKKAVADAKKQQVRLLCLPELTITGYGCQDMFLRPWVSHKALKYLEELVNISENIYFTIGIPLFHNQVLYNGIALIGEKRILGITLKQNLPDDGIYYEPRWFSPWKSGQKSEVNIGGRKIQVGDIIYQVDGHKVGIEVCEDAWRESRPALNFIKDGVDIILNPSASHFEFGKVAVREKLMRNSSGKFNCTYVYANLVGNEAGRLIYEGDLIIAQKGSILKSNTTLLPHLVNMISLEVNPSKPAGITNEPESRIDKKEIEFLNAVTLALYDYLRKSRSRCFVLSLSGGADSACCAVLVSQMVSRMVGELGEEEFLHRIHREDMKGKPKESWLKELLITVYQSTDNSSDTTYQAARGLAEELGATFYNWSVQDEIDTAKRKIESQLDRKLTWEKDDVSLQNLQARMRSPFVWSLANIFNGLLITTSNRSEGDVGYATMDGDTSGSLAPIAGVDKVFVRTWLKWAENELKISSLKAINNQAPTAELRPEEFHQTDEKDLMPYEVLRDIERMFLIKNLSPEEIVEPLMRNHSLDKSVSNNYVNRFMRLWTRNQWKRERLAPSFHLDDFNIDPKTWMRFPILSGKLES